MLRDRGGRELILGQYWDYEREEWTNREDSRMPEQHAVSAVPVDWDADGDYDLVLGTASGQLVRWMNLGTRTELAFAEDAERIEISGLEIGHPDEPEIVVYEPDDGTQQDESTPPQQAGHSMPEIADWDQDGAWDLIIGTDDGAVRWARNIGALGSPKFAPLQELVAPSDEADLVRSLGDAQVDVADLNGDGRVDLIVGDQRDVDWEATLSASQRQRLGELQEQLSASSDVLQVLYGEDEQAKQALDPEQKSKAEGLMREYEALRPERTTHGYVWFYARAAPGGG
jgi:hypothetical protein